MILRPKLRYVFLNYGAISLIKVWRRFCDGPIVESDGSSASSDENITVPDGEMPLMPGKYLILLLCEKVIFATRARDRC